MLTENWLKELNNQQLKAVTSENQNIYLIAGAGTGKTKTLTMKIAYLIKHVKIPAKKILAITFTNKATLEMKERLSSLKINIKETTICTFHALGHQILRKFINYEETNEYNNNFQIIDTNDSIRIIKNIIKELNLNKDKFNANSIRKNISFIKINLEQKMNHILKEVKNIYYKYQSFLKTNNLIDFDDLLILPYYLLKNNDSISNYYQQQFSHLLIDEFQDTDFLQYQIIKLMTSPQHNLFAVGDPDQNIYSFRGADIRNNQLFIKDFQAQIMVLEHNYRSKNNILKKANLLIKNNNNNKFQKKLQSSLGQGNKVFFQMFHHYLDEGQFITEKIKYLVQEEKYQYEDIAILYRFNGLERNFEDNLLKNNIPYVIFNNISFYQRKEIKDILAYIKVLIDPFQDFYLKRIINVPNRKIGQKTLEYLENISQENNISLFEALDYEAKNSDSKNKNLLHFKKLLDEMIQKINSNDFHQTEDIIDYIEEKTNYSKILSKKQAIVPEDNESLFYIKELKTIFKNTEQTSNNNVLQSIKDLLNQISLYSQNNYNDNQNKVKLSTIHKVKGLEFKIVFIVCFEDNILPLNTNQENFLKSNNILEEERRLAYVAVTRAKEQLFLTGSFQRTIFGKNYDTKESIFIQEMKLKNNPDINSPNDFLKNLKNNYHNHLFDFKIGEKIQHNYFGVGIIININIKDHLFTVVFPKPFGIKKITYLPSVMNFKKLN